MTSPTTVDVQHVAAVTGTEATGGRQLDHDLPPLARLALVVGRFRDLDDAATVAAVATDDGKAAHLRYGDLRTLLTEALAATERLGRIADWHQREAGPAGTVGDYCTECGTRWPCDTSRMADGTYTDPEEG